MGYASGLRRIPVGGPCGSRGLSAGRVCGPPGGCSWDKRGVLMERSRLSRWAAHEKATK